MGRCEAGWRTASVPDAVIHDPAINTFELAFIREGENSPSDFYRVLTLSYGDDQHRYCLVQLKARPLYISEAFFSASA